MEASESVQPEGQGAEAELDSSLYPGLNDVPSEYRQHLDPILKEVSSNANKKIEDVNSKLKGWEPYSNIQIGDETISVNDLEPELISDLLQFAVMSNDEESFKEWWQAVGQDSGFLNDEEEYDDEEEEEGLTGEQLQQALDQAIEQRMQPIMAERAEMQQQQGLQQADEQIGEALAALKEEHGEFDDSAVCKLALAYDEDNIEDSIKKAFEDYNAIRSDSENGLLKQKGNQPPRPEGEGSADTTPKKITDFNEAREAAKERLAEELSNP